MTDVAVQADAARAVNDALLTVRGLHISARIEGRERTIARGIDLDLRAGEALAIVGESGSGKSLTARAIMGLLPPGVHARGEVRYAGQDMLTLGERSLTRIRGSEIALIMQDPFTMLNPLMRCGAQIVEMVRDEAGRPLRRAARRAEAVRRLAEVGIEDEAVADAYPFQLSGGMRQRVGIAAALARDPQIVIADEPSTALDVTTQKELLVRLKELQRSRGMGLILITHDLRVAFSVCDRIDVLYAGGLVEQGATPEVEADPLHPYTLGLLLSEPPSDRRLPELAAIAGTVPDAEAVLDRCAFAARCAWCRPECEVAAPALVEVVTGRWSACVRQAEIAPELRALRREAVAPAQDESAPGDRAVLAELTDVSKTFGAHGAGRRVTALDSVSIAIGADESVGLVGESGSGKTTLARCLIGLERPTSGRIVLDGIDVSDYRALSSRDRASVRRSIQMVFQDPYSTLNPVRTVGATLREALLAREPGMRRARERVAELLKRVGLPASYADRKPVALSGGERQRVAVARALAADPKLIVCDEPVSSLDVSVQAQMLNLLAQVRRESGVSYLFITHDLAVVRQVAERIYVMRRGQVVEAGAVDVVLDRPQHEYTRMLVASIPGREVHSRP